jgi:hypothetical protein
MARQGETMIADAMTIYLTKAEKEVNDAVAKLPAYDMPPGEVRVSIPTVGKKVSLTTTWKAEITDTKALVNHLINTKHSDFLAYLQDLADSAARSKAKFSLPGVKFVEVKKAR